MNVAFIPVRGGSKSIPLKNIKKINGMPLVYWTIKAACECKYIDIIYVSTDSEIIMNTIDNFKCYIKDFNKIKTISRSKESATDTASTEFAMLEFANNYDFDNIILIQATSPLLTYNDLNKGFELLFQSNTDSVISVVKQKRFNWQYEINGNVIPTNYNIYKRPRRQEFNGYLVENGAFYITSKQLLIKNKCRISGNIKAVEMNEESYFEIDEPSDWIIIEELLKRRNKYINKFDIKMFLTDCDGCMTDGGMYYSEKGDEMKKFNTSDGVALKIIKDKGIITGIITGENVKLVKKRAQKLEVDIVEIGCDNKLEKIKELSEIYSINLCQIAYLGDDLNDIDVMKAVGYPFCPKNAIDEIKQLSIFVSDKNGGEGVIRDIVDKFFNN